MICKISVSEAKQIWRTCCDTPRTCYRFCP